MNHFKMLVLTAMAAATIGTGALAAATTASAATATTPRSASSVAERPRICFEFAFWKYCI